MEKIWIRDPGWKKFGSGIWDGKKSDLGSAIQDKHPGSATLGVIMTHLSICLLIYTFMYL
jgi:hypothetical protein